MTASVGYTGGAAINLVVPDFTSVSGWNNAWAPAPADPVDWEISAVGGQSFLGVMGQGCTDGGRGAFGFRSGTA